MEQYLVYLMEEEFRNLVKVTEDYDLYWELIKTVPMQDEVFYYVRICAPEEVYIEVMSVIGYDDDDI